MSYILIVNPSTLSAPATIMGDAVLANQISNGVFVATCLASFLGTMLMALGTYGKSSVCTCARHGT